MSVEHQKRAAGEAAAALVQDGMTVGLGTGTTAAWFVRSLAARGCDIRAVPSSRETARLAGDLGLKLIELDDANPVDLTVDGADEIAPGLALIKGGGGALLREKLVWTASRRCVVIADAGKIVKSLGKAPLAIEVVRFGHATIARRIGAALEELGLAPSLALRRRDGAPFLTDGGNLIYDAACGPIAAPAALAGTLSTLTGVVEHGLFLDLAERALVGTANGVRTIRPDDGEADGSELRL
ncbi:MAG: ribose-5-phosphate isomerase RpiA [Caulobacteraceae bacterium]